MIAVDRSTPSFTTFDPRHIPSQLDVVHAIDFEYDYSIGSHDILLSGSVGSSKSLTMAHCAVKHLLRYPGARCIMGRLSLPDIKRTIYTTIMEHLACEELEDGKDYFSRDTTAEIWFPNGSEIVPVYWKDKKFKRIMSINASIGIIEELTESDENYKKAFFAIKQRIGRLPHIKEKWLMSATNPDSPKHWAFKYFIEPIAKGEQSPTRHVYYSKTKDNPFLDPSYIRQLREDLDPKEARRQLDGEWVEIDEERVYHSYQSERNYRKTSFKHNERLPIALNFDFNIALGKPMSMAVYQKNAEGFHIFNEAVVEGARTKQIMEELDGKGVLDLKTPLFIVHGDATGGHNDTRNIQSDYDIICKYLSDKGVKFELQVPRANPPIRNRHNRVNAWCFNDLGQARVFVYKDAPTADEGFRLTALKKGGDYVEDDSKSYQHITTAIGYGIYYETTIGEGTKIHSQKVR